MTHDSPKTVCPFFSVTSVILGCHESAALSSINKVLSFVGPDFLAFEHQLSSLSNNDIVSSSSMHYNVFFQVCTRRQSQH